MAQNLRRIKKEWLNPRDISSIAKMMSISIRGYFDEQDIKYRGKEASDILDQILKKRGFNDYSGNLSRSYYVKVSRKGASYVFTAGDNAAKDPVIRQTKTRYLYYRTKMRHPMRKSSPKRRQYIVRKGKLDFKQQYYRVFNPDTEVGPGKHRYLKKLNKRSSPKRDYRRVGGKDVFVSKAFEIGNDTPYAAMVQQGKKHSYNVLSPSQANELKRQIEKNSMYTTRVAVRNMCYDFNRGYIGWYDKRKNPFG